MRLGRFVPCLNEGPRNPLCAALVRSHLSTQARLSEQVVMISVIPAGKCAEGLMRDLFHGWHLPTKHFLGSIPRELIAISQISYVSFTSAFMLFLPLEISVLPCSPNELQVIL